MDVPGITSTQDNESVSTYCKPRSMLKTIHYKYSDFFPVVRSSCNDDIWLNIRVKAYSNAHILFTSTTEVFEGMPVYEIVLGADHNRYCSIRRQQMRNTATHVELEHILSGDEWRSFWLRISSKGLIEVGNAGNDLPFMLWQDETPLDVQYCSFSSWYNTAAFWTFDWGSETDNEDFEVLTGTDTSFSE